MTEEQLSRTLADYQQIVDALIVLPAPRVSNENVAIVATNLLLAVHLARVEWQLS